jgi:serine/threonine-protein kinase
MKKKEFAALSHHLQKFERGDVIIKEGDASSSLYLLITGRVLVTKTEDTSTIRLGKLSPGELFGEMSFFQKKPRRSNVVANEEVLVLKMDDDLFSKMSPELRDKIKSNFIELLITRLDEMNSSLMKLARLMRG